jgi:hypothetical protein
MLCVRWTAQSSDEKRRCWWHLLGVTVTRMLQAVVLRSTLQYDVCFSSLLPISRVTCIVPNFHSICWFINQLIGFRIPYWRRHHGMTRLRAANRRDIQIWRVAANVLNKQSRTTDKGCPSAWGLGDGLTPHRKKKQLVTKCYTGLLGLLWTRQWTFEFHKRREISLLAEWLLAS